MKSINSLRDRGFEGKRDRGNPSGMQGRREEVGQISFSFPSCTQIPPYPLPSVIICVKIATALLSEMPARKESMNLDTN